MIVGSSYHELTRKKNRACLCDLEPSLPCSKGRKSIVSKLNNTILKQMGIKGHVRPRDMFDQGHVTVD